MHKHVIAPLTAGVLLALAGAAHAAATKTASFTVSATVVDNCTIGAAPLSLGTFDGTADLTASSNITVRCSNNTDYSVALSPGTSNSYANRTLRSPDSATNLVYNLYTANDYLTVWGDNSPGTGRIDDVGEGMGTPILHPVFGRLLASQNQGAIDAGSFTDTITATISY